MLRAQGIHPSVLFSIPGVELAMVTIDTHQCLDLGVTQDLIGNVLWQYLESPLSAGRNREDRLKRLWRQLKNFQKQYGPPDSAEEVLSKQPLLQRQCCSSTEPWQADF